MVQLVGFSCSEQDMITGLVGRFGASDYRLGELKRVEKADMPGYCGRVVPQAKPCGGLEMTMYLASTSPFTIAHELAHVSDISVRRSETLVHIAAAMPGHWHLAHRMSSEYYANRVACHHVDEPEVLAAFKSDAAGLHRAVAEEDWASGLIYYALLLGLFHGMGREDCEPARLIAPAIELPERITRAMADFRRQAGAFFDGYHRHQALAA